MEVVNPSSDKLETFYLKGEDLISVFTTAYTSDVIDVPFEINKLLNDDLSSVKEKLSTLFNEPGNGAGIGMRLSVWCAEEYPFNSPEVIKRETSKYPEISGLSPTTYETNICDAWGVSKVSVIENKPINSSTPVLLISGEYDEITPSKWANEMNENLSQSFHLVFRGWKHTPTTNWGNQCAMTAANNFFNNPKLKPTPDCLEGIKAPKFRTE